MGESITILGATGSIGRSTLSVLEQHPQDFEVFALTGNHQYEELAKQCLKYKPNFAVVMDPVVREKLTDLLNAQGSKTEVLQGQKGLCDVVSHPEVETVVAAIVGAAGLQSTMAAVESSERVLLANKEALVMASGLFKKALMKYDVTFLPVDSEHNGILQCLPKHESMQRIEGVTKLILPASGGPFRGWTLEQMQYVTPDQACAHPNWSMGQKISVDSATLMNKGLEVIEASSLFDLAADAIEVVIHPQSIVHGMVQYADGSVLAHMGNPDMRIPIAHTLAWPKRMSSGVSDLDFTSIPDLQFSKPDVKNFPCLRLAYDALTLGRDAPTIMNAANEVAVEAFLSSRIRFTDIATVVAETLNSSEFSEPESLTRSNHFYFCESENATALISTALK